MSSSFFFTSRSVLRELSVPGSLRQNSSSSLHADRGQFSRAWRATRARRLAFCTRNSWAIPSPPSESRKKLTQTSSVQECAGVLKTHTTTAKLKPGLRDFLDNSLGQLLFKLKKNDDLSLIKGPFAVLDLIYLVRQHRRAVGLSAPPPDCSLVHTAPAVWGLGPGLCRTKPSGRRQQQQPGQLLLGVQKAGDWWEVSHKQLLQGQENPPRLLSTAYRALAQPRSVGNPTE